MHALGLTLAALVGLSLGLLGGGGSILTVPIFVYVLGFAAKPAIAMSLVVVGATSAVGAFRHWRAGNVNARVAILFGGVAMVGAYVGARRVAPLLSGTLQLTLLAVVMLAAAVSMFRSGRAQSRGGAASPNDEAGSTSLWLMLAVGVGVGLLTGVAGVGGGFLIVPALAVVARVPMKQAIGTSLVVITMNSFSGFVGYLGHADIAWDFVALFTAIAIGGILVGTHLVRYASQAALKQGFAGFLVLLGIVILLQNARS